MSTPSSERVHSEAAPAVRTQHVSDAGSENIIAKTQAAQVAPEVPQYRHEADEPTSTRDDQPQDPALTSVSHEVQESEIPYPALEDHEPLLPPPDFKPFFTLIEDEQGDHHHPTVHYVFTSDEDADILTNAALQTINLSEQPRQDGEVENRFVVLDLDPTGKEVISAASLSPEWQALKTQIVPAPSWGGHDEKSAERGLMLRISGQEAGKKAELKGKSKSDMNVLLKMFDERLEGLTRILGPSEKDTHDMHDDNEGTAE